MTVRNTHGQFLIRMEKYPNIVILGKYQTAKTRIECRSRICGHAWWAIPNNLTNGSGCPVCRGRKISISKTKTHERFVEEMKQFPNIGIVGKYQGVDTKIECYCFKCNNFWKPTPHDLLSGYGCPRCNESKLERGVREVLDRWGWPYKTQVRFDTCKYKERLKFDFEFTHPSGVPVLVEADGEQHFNPRCGLFKMAKQSFENLQKKDTIKNEWAKNNNRILIRVPYTEQRRIEKFLKKEIEINVP